MTSEEPSESAELRQRQEFAALKAIYARDVRDLRVKSALNPWQPLNLSITLTPHQGSAGTQEIYVQVDLIITCDDNYPYSVPTISLRNGKGISNVALSELQEKLTTRADELKGEEMIFQLSQMVQEFLHDHNKPGAKSFYDEMLKSQKEKEERILMEKRMEAEQQVLQQQLIMEEVKRREELLIAENKDRIRIRQLSESSDSNRRFSINDSSPETSEHMCTHQKTRRLEFGNRIIHRGCCIKHSSANHITYIGIDSESGELVIVHEWTLKTKTKKDYPHLQKQIASIEQEMKHLAKLKHQNLSQYSGMKYLVNGADSTITIYLLREFFMGVPFSIFLNQNLRIDKEFLKHIAKGVLTVLDHLHRNNVIHKNLGASSVYINELGNVRVSNHSIYRRILDLNTQTYSKNYSRKIDIFKYGVLLLSLLKGQKVAEENLEIPTSVHSDFYDFLSKCLAQDGSDRYTTTTQLLNHAFFQKSEIAPLMTRELGGLENRNNSPEIIQTDLQILSQSGQNGQSRIKSEFEFLQHLGKGAFGDVIKARNKLDGGNYAIKRIKLNPKNKSMTKKMIREVQLLSRLNHENVVRYYNSWIETGIKKDDEARSGSTSPEVEEKRPYVKKLDPLSVFDNVELEAFSVKNTDTNYSKSAPAFNSDGSDSDDSSDEEGPWGEVYKSESESESVEFKRASTTTSKNDPSSPSTKGPEDSGAAPDLENRIDFMYIQMEFCEKSTLRTAIDDNLYRNEARTFRLFREMVEGLAHIHQQGMIHRDLKPVNIFLDSGDHVKIGDFGLATTSLISKQTDNFIARITPDGEREDITDESKSGLVGTAMYVSPEVNSSTRMVYTTKVDIYSLGIILFEMCYPPLKTAMERIKILTNLRSKEVVFPEDFINKKNEKMMSLIRWLLDHDMSKRPTSVELLQSEYIPPPVLEERILRELVRHTLSKPQMKDYKYLIASCFMQPVTAIQDISYGKDPSCQNVTKPLELHNYVKNVCTKIFKQHGGENLTTPLLMPKSNLYDGVDSYVKLMTHDGGIASLPHDLRVPFARFVACNDIILLRRYSIERVFREKKVYGFQPRELYECAFDIVSPNQGSLLSDAEIIYLVCEIIEALPGVKKKHCVIRLNHTKLLTAILLHSGIKDKHFEIFTLISNVKNGKVPKFQLQNHLISLGLSDNMISILLNLFFTEFEVSKAGYQFHMITKKKSGEASQLARQALQDLNKIAQNAEAFGIKHEMVISPGLVYNPKQYSGMIFQFVCEMKKKHKHHNMEVLAAGGRYDSMLAHYRSTMEKAKIMSKDIRQCAVGVSISLDRLVQAVQKEEAANAPIVDSLDVVVWSEGSNEMVKEKTKILLSLWNAGIKSALIEATNIEEIQDKLNELKCTHVVKLRDTEQGTVFIKNWNEARYCAHREGPVPISEVVEHLQRSMKTWNESSQDRDAGPSPFLMRSDSKSSWGEHVQEAKEANVDVILVPEEKLSANSRRRFENQIRSQLGGLFKKLTGSVIVFGLTADTNIIRNLSSYLEFESEHLFRQSADNVIDRHPRQKNYIQEICDELYEHKMRKNATIVLFGMSECFYRVIM